MNQDFSQIFSTPLRILVVDNNEDTANTYKELLELWGYQPIIAKGKGKALMQNAKEKTEIHRCQLALVDLRLIDDLDDEDKSGLELAKQIKPTVTIILTGYGTIQLAVENLQNKNVASFIIKGGSPQGILEEIKKVALKISSQERSLKIGPPEIILSLAESLFDENIPLPARDQLLDTLARLFPEAENLRLRKLDQSPSTPGFSDVPRPRSAILKIWEDDLQPVIVKLARVPKIKKEVKRYKMHIHKRLGNLSAPVFEEAETLWDIGGIKFSYSGNIEETFEHFYKIQQQTVIDTSLKRFFTQTWSAHYKKAKEIPDISLFELYCQVWGNEWHERALQFKDFDIRQFMGRKRWDELHAIHPIQWLQLRIIEELAGGISQVDKTFVAVTHGDLHGNNMLIDANHIAWVIDFERTGEGHALQDFVELESDIINRVKCAHENFPAFFHLCLVVTGQKEIQSLKKKDFISDDQEIQKALQVISTIRSLARRMTRISDSRQYLIGLFFNTIFRATITPDVPLTYCQQRALMLASIICYRLEHWTDPWPPKEWQNQ